MATTRIRYEAILGPVRSVILDEDETGPRVTRTTYSLNVLDGWVRELERTDESGLVWEASSPWVQSPVRAVLDAAPECAEFIAESHLLWIKALRQAGRTRQASAQRRALEGALRRHRLRLTPAGKELAAGTTGPGPGEENDIPPVRLPRWPPPPQPHAPGPELQ
jgi:hypothetical protein